MQGELHYMLYSCYKGQLQYVDIDQVLFKEQERVDRLI